jgi:hypothetical protein
MLREAGNNFRIKKRHALNDVELWEQNIKFWVELMYLT